MSTANTFDEAVPPGSVVVRTSSNRPLFEFMHLIRPSFGELLSPAQTVKDEDGRERVRWQPGESWSDGEPGNLPEGFVAVLKQKCADARTAAEELRQTRWYQKSGDTESVAVYNRFARLFGRPTIDDVRSSGVSIDHALVHTLCEVLERTARTVEVSLRRPRFVQTEIGPKLIGWGILPKDSGRNLSLSEELVLKRRHAEQNGTESVVLFWDDDPRYEDGYRIERRAAGDGEWQQVGTAGYGAMSFSLGPLTSVPACEYRVLGFTRDGEVCSNIVRIDPPTPLVGVGQSTPAFHASSPTISPPIMVSVLRADTGTGLHIGWKLPPGVDAGVASNLVADVQTRVSDNDEWTSYQTVPAALLGVEANDLSNEQSRQVRVALIDGATKSSWSRASYEPGTGRPWWVWLLLLLLLALLIWLLLMWIPTCSSSHSAESVPTVQTPATAPRIGNPASSGQRIVPAPTVPNKVIDNRTPVTPSQDSPATVVSPIPPSNDRPTSPAAVMNHCPSCRLVIPTIPDGPCRFCPYCGESLEKKKDDGQQDAVPGGKEESATGSVTSLPGSPAPAAAQTATSKTGRPRTPEPPAEVGSANGASKVPASEVQDGNSTPQISAGSNSPEAHLKNSAVPIEQQSKTVATEEADQRREQLKDTNKAPNGVMQLPKVVEVDRKLMEGPPSGRGMRLKFLVEHPSTSGFDPLVVPDPTLGLGHSLGFNIFVDSRSVSQSGFQQLRAARMETGDLVAYGLAFLDMQEVLSGKTGGESGLFMATAVKPDSLSTSQRPLFLDQIGGPPGVQVAFQPLQVEVTAVPCDFFIDVDPPTGIADESWTKDIELRIVQEDSDRGGVIPSWTQLPKPNGSGSIRLICRSSPGLWKGTVELVNRSSGRVIFRTQRVELEFLR